MKRKDLSLKNCKQETFYENIFRKSDLGLPIKVEMWYTTLALQTGTVAYFVPIMLADTIWSGGR